MHEKCYDNIYNMCLPSQGDVGANLYTILKCTARLNRFAKATQWKCTPKYESISSWFVDLLYKIPNETCEIMKQYIEAILTDSSLSVGNEALTRNLDICVKYDSAMYRICNESVLLFLDDLALSSDVWQRCTCAEMMARMLSVESECNWVLFENEVSQEPREVELLMKLVGKMSDVNNTVKVKSLNGFLNVTRDGNKKVKEIFQVSFRF